MMTCPCRNVAPWEVRADSIFPPFLARKYWVTVKWVTVMQESFLDHLQIERQSRFSLILDTGAQESTAITDTHFCALACSLSKEANARPRSKVAWAFSEAVVSLAWNRDQNSRKAAPFFSNFMICPFFFSSLQCCVGFCPTALWISRSYTDIPLLPSLAPRPHTIPLGRYRMPGCSPVLHRSFPPALRLIPNSAYMLMLLSSFVPLSLFLTVSTSPFPTSMYPFLPCK